MLSGSSFYHRIIRKNVIAFGSIFNDITLKRYSYNTFTELERFKVPLSYAPKETFITKLLGDLVAKLGSLGVILNENNIIPDGNCICNHSPEYVVELISVVVTLPAYIPEVELYVRAL